jgi:CheY-like chemotaxis protein
MAQRGVLIVASNPLIREVFHDVFLTHGHECLLAADGREGVEMHRGWRPSLVVNGQNQINPKEARQ